MAPINPILNKSISFATKHTSGAIKKNGVARYVKACGKRSVLECKPWRGKIYPEELGVVFSDGQINFQKEESALKYIYARLLEALNRPISEQFERIIVKKGSSIIGEGDGTSFEASNAFESIKGMLERCKKDLPRDIEVFHSHPDMYGIGRTSPLSRPVGGDIDTFFRAKLKKIVAVNSKGEFNSIEVGKDFTPENFELFQDGCITFEDKKIYGGLLSKYKKISEKIFEYCDSENVNPRVLERLNKKKSKIEHQIREVESSTEGYIEKVSKVLHEYYKQANDYGMIYTTNFSNLP